jgi:hypothetical protein
MHYSKASASSWCRASAVQNATSKCGLKMQRSSSKTVSSAATGRFLPLLLGLRVFGALSLPWGADFFGRIR